MPTSPRGTEAGRVAWQRVFKDSNAERLLIRRDEERLRMQRDEPSRGKLFMPLTEKDFESARNRLLIQLRDKERERDNEIAEIKAGIPASPPFR